MLRISKFPHQLNKGVKDAMATNTNDVIHHQSIKQKHAIRPQYHRQIQKTRKGFGEIPEKSTYTGVRKAGGQECEW